MPANPLGSGTGAGAIRSMMSYQNENNNRSNNNLQTRDNVCQSSNTKIRKTANLLLFSSLVSSAAFFKMISFVLIQGHHQRLTQMSSADQHRGCCAFAAVSTMSIKCSVVLCTVQFLWQTAETFPSLIFSSHFPCSRLLPLEQTISASHACY